MIGEEKHFQQYPFFKQGERSDLFGNVSIGKWYKDLDVFGQSKGDQLGVRLGISTLLNTCF